LTCDDPSKVGTSVEVEVSYRVLGAYASSGIAAGINGKIPVALKPRGHGQFFRMLTKAWKNYITVENIKRGFRATGIFPFIPAAISEDAYAPSTLYETSTSTDVPTLEGSSQVNSTVSVPKKLTMSNSYAS
jgi:hypothetical protein